MSRPPPPPQAQSSDETTPLTQGVIQQGMQRLFVMLLTSIVLLELLKQTIA